MFEDKIVMITGGTGSVGTALVERLLKENPKKIRIVTNDENSIWESQQKFGEQTADSKLRWALGDVRDREKMKTLISESDMIFHCAAIKHVPIAEYSPLEAIDVNLNGLINLVQLALETPRITHFCNISTDKVVNAVGVMGRTKALTEDIIHWANFFKSERDRECKFFNVRFCNVWKTRGSVLETWEKQAEELGHIEVTDVKMDRYFMRIEDAVDLILEATEATKGGETFILKDYEKRYVLDMASDFCKEYLKENHIELKIKVTGIRKGERLFEELMTEEEKKNAVDVGDMWVLKHD